LIQFERFIVCGDSFSEGMSDEVINHNYRGWADRVADIISVNNPDFRYANLAIRGKLVKQVLDDQLPPAIKLVTGPKTLFSFHGGANDAMRPTYKPEIVLAQYRQAVRMIAASGATIILFTVLEGAGKAGKAGKMADLWAERFGAFNNNVRAVGNEVGAIIVDISEEKFFADRRFLAFDRLHLNALGQDRLAQGVLEKIALPFDKNWRTPLPPTKPRPWIVTRALSALWFFTFVAPWIWRRIRGASSGDGRIAKYPTPVKWPVN